MVPSCAEGGVLGILPGIIGTMQAAEAIKLILGKGNTLIGKLLFLDVMEMKIRELRLRKDPNCPICGENPTIKELIDYEEFCGLGRGEEQVGGDGSDLEITVDEFYDLLQSNKNIVILDVREPSEYEICHIQGSRLIPLGELPSRVNELDTADEIVVHCHHGVRSLRATNFLRSIGFRKVKSLKGGIDAWAVNYDPTMPRY
jgi:adenylyltransferase/sulfurtransferase